ncbi:MAG: TatD family hydrolase [Ginsengibacter sp.]
MFYIDIHTHAYKPHENVVCIENVLTNFNEIPGERPISAGLHPWYLKNAEEELSQLQSICHQQNVVAIGECGLDRLAETDWDRQVTYFEAQLDLATSLNKPVIIHCVRAFAETMGMLKGITVPVIFHGVNKKLSAIEPLIENGYFLSFGKAILQPSETIIHTLRAVPPAQLFLETDDSEATIQDIYKTAAGIRNVSENEIALQLQKNYHSIFNYGGH